MKEYRYQFAFFEDEQVAEFCEALDRTGIDHVLRVDMGVYCWTVIIYASLEQMRDIAELRNGLMNEEKASA